ncbi:DUF294 nucleotidyltransferase-like domain-containing protein [Corynebacterium sp. A21]|uniref:DUF294 nucleotidyltransferase-like domain-containing protein n=1 Tax=Corynebacterium sp. A21 TaxID=3457318 RepID=UPI003FD1A300
MIVELEEVRAFLAEIEPFLRLPEEELAQLPAKMTMRYARRGDTLLRIGEPNGQLFIIRSGAVDLVDEDGVLLDRRDAGRSFGYSTLSGESNSRYTMIAVEDCLLLNLPEADFQELAQRHPDLARYFSSQSRRIRAVADELRQDTSAEVLRTRLGGFKIPEPVIVSADTSIRQAAIKMEELRVSSLLIGAPENLEGIITDRDLRGRVVAVGLDIDLPVGEIMTMNPRIGTSDTLAFEAMLIMTELRIHHLPIVDGGQVTGIVTSADIMRLMRQDPIYLTADVARRSSPEELAGSYTQASEIGMRFFERGASAEETAGLMTIVADAIARRLLTLAEEKLGKPPVPYAFAVVGSQGRHEMGFASDQDNVLILDDSYEDAAHGAYFAELSEFVCRGLDRAGQVLCPGDMMAMNPEWRKTISEWEDAFHLWVTAPDPDALLFAQTFFDLRAIHGELSLGEQVHSAAVVMASGASRMQAHLASLAVRREPPLGFFRGLVVERSGEYTNTLNVKKGGTAGIVQMARLFSLNDGIVALGTRARLSLSAGGGAVSERGANDLLDAFEFLRSVTFRHQTQQLRNKQHPDYNIDPKQLSKMDREHLRDAFQIIKGMQNALATRYPVRNI